MRKKVQKDLVNQDKLMKRFGDPEIWYGPLLGLRICVVSWKEMKFVWSTQ